MPRHSPAVEDYLKAIYELQEESGGGSVGTAALAARLGVTRAAVTGMVKKLAASPRALIAYTRYHGTRLTARGARAALEVVRHHRLIEAYLIEALGYSWDEVHTEADHLEHAISEDLEARIAAFLGDPRSDPHGAPIPLKDGSLPRRREVRLTDVAVGQGGEVSRVPDEDPEMLRYFDRVGLRPPHHLEVTDRGPFEGPVLVRIGNSPTTIALNRRVTDGVFIAVDPGSEGD
jgi:DtxR family Mn-dependent transcriptional regulator